MSETKHTPEPWYLAERVIEPMGEKILAGEIDGPNDEIEIADTYTYSRVDGYANAARIVACVNACEGLADPSGLAELVEAAEYMLGVQTSAVLRSEAIGETGMVDRFSRLRSALARVKRTEG